MVKIIHYLSCFYLATGITDPHMITLDGFEYTFNGYGEYHVLQIPPIDFELQGRMQPLIDIMAAVLVVQYSKRLQWKKMVLMLYR